MLNPTASSSRSLLALCARSCLPCGSLPPCCSFPRFSSLLLTSLLFGCCSRWCLFSACRYSSGIVLGQLLFRIVEEDVTDDDNLDAKGEVIGVKLSACLCPGLFLMESRSPPCSFPPFPPGYVRAYRKHAGNQTDLCPRPRSSYDGGLPPSRLPLCFFVLPSDFFLCPMQSRTLPSDPQSTRHWLTHTSRRARCPSVRAT